MASPSTLRVRSGNLLTHKRSKSDSSREKTVENQIFQSSKPASPPAPPSLKSRVLSAAEQQALKAKLKALPAVRETSRVQHTVLGSEKKSSKELPTSRRSPILKSGDLHEITLSLRGRTSQEKVRVMPVHSRKSESPTLQATVAPASRVSATTQTSPVLSSTDVRTMILTIREKTKDAKLGLDLSPINNEYAAAQDELIQAYDQGLNSLINVIIQVAYARSFEVPDDASTYFEAKSTCPDSVPPQEATVRILENVTALNRTLHSLKQNLSFTQAHAGNIQPIVDRQHLISFYETQIECVMIMVRGLDSSVVDRERLHFNLDSLGSNLGEDSTFSEYTTDGDTDTELFANTDYPE